MRVSHPLRIILLAVSIIFTIMCFLYTKENYELYKPLYPKVLEMVKYSGPKRPRPVDEAVAIQVIKPVPVERKLIDPVQARLDESKQNWDRAMEKRKIMESQNVFQANLPWVSGIFFWDFFYPSFDCPHTVERIGKVGDGGKWICGVKHLSKNCNKSPVIVYSFGVNGEVTFEEEILERTNFTVYMFDHTINVTEIYARLPIKYPGRVFPEKIGLAAEEDGDELNTLASIMERNGHEFIDILKVDIEWAEWKVIAAMKEMFPSGKLPIGQLSIEFHLPKGKKENQQAHIDAIKLLEEMGLRPFKNEFNIGGMLRFSHLPLFSEYSFINVNFDNCLLHSG